MELVMTRRLLLPLLAVLALSAAGCGTATTKTTGVNVASTLVPDGGPHAELKLTGHIEQTNHGKQLRVSDSTLQAMARETITLDEPFKKRKLSFKAVPLRDVLKLAGVPSTATTLHAVALNDYVVDLPLDVATADGTYLAVRNGDGSKIAVEDGGPIRIVFLDKAKGADVENYWIWSLSTLSVR
jgi:hypothetical protein